jgi:hypothetical protein
MFIIQRKANVLSGWEDYLGSEDYGTAKASFEDQKYRYANGEINFKCRLIVRMEQLVEEM